MLLHFPKPYPNEDFRSIIHRYYIRSGHLTFQDACKTLFDVKSKRNPYLHHNIEVMVELLNSKKYSTNYFVEEHTIFPLIKPFLSERRNAKFLVSINIKDTLKNKKIWWNNIDSKVKYCPACLKLDFEKYGEVYAHRFHQLKFLRYCYIHLSELTTSCKICESLLSNHEGTSLLTTPYCINGHNISKQQENRLECPLFVKGIINDFQYLNNHSLNINKAFILDLFYVALGNRGYIDGFSNQIQIKKLKIDFLNYVDDKLPFLELNQGDIINTTIKMIFSSKNNRAPNILTYLLLIQFLSQSIGNFISPAFTYAVDVPFGSSAQPCLNQICKYYNKKVITSFKKLYYPTYVQGTFACSHCGFTYGRKWIWSKDKQKGEAKSTFLIYRGELWESEVLKLYYQGQSIKDISRNMGVYKEAVSRFLRSQLGEEYNHRFNPRNNTLYKHLLRDANSQADNEVAFEEIVYGIKEASATAFEEKRLQIRRESILNLVNRDANLTRVQIKALARSDYCWLMKYDKEWMEGVLPKSIFGGNR